MNKHPCFLVLSLLAIWIYVPATEGVDCYECNMYLCSRNNTDSHLCSLTKQYRNALNDTRRKELWDKMEAISGCNETIKKGCYFCTKILTTSRVSVSGGNYEVNTVLSKLCASRKAVPRSGADEGEDDCKVTGPRYSAQHVCDCWGDLCNTSWSLRASSLVVYLIVVVSVLAHMSV